MIDGQTSSSLGDHYIDTGIDNLKPKPNVAILSLSPCLWLYAYPSPYWRGRAIKYLLSVNRPHVLSVDAPDVSEALYLSLPLDSLGFASCPWGDMDFNIRYRADFDVIAQNEPLPSAFRTNEHSQIVVAHRRYRPFVRRFNAVARYYGKEEMPLDNSSEAESVKTRSLVMLGWKLTIERVGCLTK